MEGDRRALSTLHHQNRIRRFDAHGRDVLWHADRIRIRIVLVDRHLPRLESSEEEVFRESRVALANWAVYLAAIWPRWLDRADGGLANASARGCHIGGRA